MISAEQRDFLLPHAYNAALKAGAAILDVYAGGDYAVEQKSDHTPITLADRRAHEIIKAHLSQTRIPLLSEEGREMLYAERCGWDLFWMVDPLDGTKEFIKGNGEFTVNIALVADNRPVLAVIYVPHIRKIYFADGVEGMAWRKLGVKADPGAQADMAAILERAEALPVTGRANEPIRIAMSRSHKTPETERHVEGMRTIHPSAIVVEQGSSYKFCMLAEGGVEYYPRMTETYEWDTAAGELILELSGGSTRAMEDGAPLQYNKESLKNPHFVCRSKYMA